MDKSQADKAAIFARTCSYPVRDGNALTPLIDGEPAFRRICEAIEAAGHSLWVTIAFLNDDFEMPDGRGSLFDLLDAAKARGLDVRALFWRNNPGSGFDEAYMFSGHQEHRTMLAGRGSRFLARWDRAEKNYCQHQKSWIVDAGQDDEIAFVGGINLESASMVSPGHAIGDFRHTHDIYAEIRGPCATDVHHNFVQRWNGASDRQSADGVWPDAQLCDDLAFPTEISSPKGRASAQVQRTVRAGLYSDGTASPGAEPFDIAGGERSCFEQYETAIAQARRYIYFENQALGLPATIEALHAALERGVMVTVLLPAEADMFTKTARKDPRAQPFFDRVGALGDHAHFLMAGIAAKGADGVRRNIYVHAKAAVIDDSWMTIGSCNIGARSFFGDTELNISSCSSDQARAFRTELFAEHLSVDTAGMDAVKAMQLYQRIARENAARIARGSEPQSLVFALDPNLHGS